MPKEKWNQIGTRIFGQSDDNIYTEGESNGQYSKYGTDDNEKGILIVASDGTLLEIKYGKLDEAIWGVKVLKQGELFDRIEFCNDVDEEIYSDIVYWKKGIKWIYACATWEKIE